MLRRVVLIPRQWVVLRVKPPAVRLRPCATVVSDFASDAAVARVIDRVFLFAVVLLTASLAAVMALSGGNPVLAVEVVAGGGLAAAGMVQLPGTAT
jgi:hypothetical protein